MSTSHSRRCPLAAFRAGLKVLAFAAVGATPAALASDGGPIVGIDGGAVRGVAVPGGYAFRGLPYAAPPTGQLRWRPPESPAAWKGIREAIDFGPSCPQPPIFGPIATDEDCLYLNVSTPELGRGRGGGRPVLVWIHGGGFVFDAGSNYDPTKLAAAGIVVVTINYRLGALGFLSHPALASHAGGPSGNYGLMDQQAALRWVQGNIEKFGGDPGNITIAGQSAGGLAVLAHLVSRSSRGLFQRAIVESGSFALTQKSLSAAEAEGEAFASRAGCPDQRAQCLRNLPVADVVSKSPADSSVARLLGAVIPGVVDGKVLKESIGTALAAAGFARVPILNGTSRDEELGFFGLGVTVSGGTFVPVNEPVTAESYQRLIASVLAVSDARAAAIASEYPLSAYPSPTLALSALVGDREFACTALQMDKWMSQAAPTFAYEFNEGVATHGSELAYLFDVGAPLNPDQEALAASMRLAWANFAARGDPSSAGVLWPRFDDRAHVMSLVAPQPKVETDFAARHHCSFWAGE